MADYRWDEKDPLVLYIGKEKINLDTKGVEYARQFGQLTSWLGRYALPALMTAADTGELEGVTNIDVVASLLTNFLELGFTPESIVELSAILINKDVAFVEEHFDPGWFVEALLRSFDHREGVRIAFVRIYERFFLASPANEGDAEGQAQD